ncbi:signal recognition particle-docking protein FtsY [Laspinema sp. A4]|uniref:signal recognition particle-docking protein FtsY n=1 Tax=Laspinema sp. D2d TaxID=2953686 RepID=UPI0021BA8F06|nr:signal recognition particle-docking protein FtsY [Laspinema sp. D2d]MCT7985229.1 signal recognition particle-docking protein FtsY [Laspinema sp. D2d]
MVFNWFRRQFNEKEQKQEQEQAINPTAKQPESDAEETTPEVAEDYLNWAKAAYQNIQKQQVSSLEEPVAEEELEAEGEPGELEAEGELGELEAEGELGELEAEGELEEPEAEGELEEPEAEGDTEAEGETEPEAVPEEVIEPATALAIETSEATEISEAEAPAPAPVSFLARAEAERQARMQRLEETAVEAPIEEDFRRTSTPGQGEIEGTEIPGLAFDEGFLWSAEVLAAQGRRADEVSIEEITWLQKLRQGLDRTRRSLINQLRAIVGQGPLNKAAVMEIETALLQADVGVEATELIIEALQQKLKEEALPPAEAIAYLKKILREMLDRPFQEKYNANFVPEKETLNIWVIAGVNGAGKTTTIGKIAHLSKQSGYKTLIAAADTFRAAAVEQVKVWGSRADVEVIANPVKNSDPAAVVFDGISAAQARGTELLLVDTAGRLQNKKNLMDELAKIRRIVDRKAPDAVVESLLVLDATLGQNGLRQAQVFSEAINLSGVILTKLDGTAKGGIALAIVQQMGLPIRFIGAGEGIEDLRPFSSYEFVEALIGG